MPARQGGFTLLEIVVVLVLMGIISSFALLSVSADHTRDLVESEGQRLAAVLRYSRDAASLRLRDRGLRVTDNGYELLERRGLRWLPVADGPKGRGELPAGLRLQLTIGDLPDVLKPPEDEEEEDKPEDQDPPQVWIFASGELLPFEIELADAAEEHRFLVEGSANGTVATRFESYVR
jgi:general secretion pathway protein H